MRTFSLFVLILASCTGAPAVSGLPDGYPLEDQVAEVTDELELHRANLVSCNEMDELQAEITRHKTVANPRYDAMRVGLVAMGSCATPEARSELASLMNGIDATELGRDEAVRHTHGMGDARHVADFYAGGVSELVQRMVVISAQQSGCYR